MAPDKKNHSGWQIRILVCGLIAVYLIALILQNSIHSDRWSEEDLQKRYQIQKISSLLQDYYKSNNKYPDSLRHLEKNILMQWEKGEFLIEEFHKDHELDMEFRHNFSTSFDFSIHDYAKKYYFDFFAFGRKVQDFDFIDVAKYIEKNKKQHDLLDPNKPIGIKNIATQQTGYGKAYSDFRDALGEKLFINSEDHFQRYREGCNRVLLYIPLKEKQAFLIFNASSTQVVNPKMIAQGELVYKNKRILNKRLDINFDVNTSTIEVINLDELIKGL